MHENASTIDVAPPSGSPATLAPPADTSVTYTREALPPVSLSPRATICEIDNASPCPRVMSPDWNQLKHDCRLFADGCCASTTPNFHLSASWIHPALVPKDAFWVQPCSPPTSGRPAASPSGLYSNICNAPGLLPNPVTSVTPAAGGRAA